MPGSQRTCDAPTCSRRFTPYGQAQVFCSVRCAALSRWADEQATADLEAESAAELAALPQARLCKCLGETITYRDEDGDNRCHDCGHEAQKVAA